MITSGDAFYLGQLVNVFTNHISIYENHCKHLLEIYATKFLKGCYKINIIKKRCYDVAYTNLKLKEFEGKVEWFKRVADYLHSKEYILSKNASVLKNKGLKITQVNQVDMTQANIISNYNVI